MATDWEKKLEESLARLRKTIGGISTEAPKVRAPKLEVPGQPDRMAGGITAPPVKIPEFPEVPYTRQDIAEYNAYLAFLNTDAGRFYPLPKDIEDYLANKDRWTAGDVKPEETVAGYSEQQLKDYLDFQRWASRYGQPGDWYPLDIQDYLANYVTAQQQLSGWQGMEQYYLPPEEQARRREESYALAQYGRQEAYRETPRYQEAFAGWMGGQTRISEALKGYVESKYPSLRAQYEAGLPRLTGFETREQARAEATKRETGWQAWLGERMPETYQEYYTQRPYQRGERIPVQSPTLRKVAW